MDLNTRILPATTRRALDYLADQEAIGQFYLIGGTALALHLGHRISEDLDWATTRATLPPNAIDSLAGGQPDAGIFPAKPLPNFSMEQEFEDTGLDPYEVHRDYEMAGAKISFHAYGDSHGRAALEGASPSSYGKAHIVDPETIYALKILALTSRITSRDLVDLYVLNQELDRGMTDLFDTLERLKPGYPPETLARKLYETPIPSHDPGFLALGHWEGASIDSIRTSLHNQVREWRREEASEFRCQAQPSPDDLQRWREPRKEEEPTEDDQPPTGPSPS